MSTLWTNNSADSVTHSGSPLLATNAPSAGKDTSLCANPPNALGKDHELGCAPQMLTRAPLEASTWTERSNSTRCRTRVNSPRFPTASRSRMRECFSSLSHYITPIFSHSLTRPPYSEKRTDPLRRSDGIQIPTRVGCARW